MALTLKPGPFVYNVCLWPPITVHQLKLRAVDYICMEKMKMMQTKFWTDLQLDDWKAEKTFSRANPRPKDPRPPSYSCYAPLSVPHSHILKEALQTNFLPLTLRKTLNPPNTDMTKYYNNGHTTDECKTLQNKIKELIWFGNLKQFVKREGESNSRPMYNRNTGPVRQCDQRDKKDERREHPLA